MSRTTKTLLTAAAAVLSSLVVALNELDAGGAPDVAACAYHRLGGA